MEVIVLLLILSQMDQKVVNLLFIGMYVRSIRIERCGVVANELWRKSVWRIQRCTCLFKLIVRPSSGGYAREEEALKVYFLGNNLEIRLILICVPDYLYIVLNLDYGARHIGVGLN